MHLSQAQIGERLGLSRFQVGRLLDRAVEESIVRIEIVHPTARLVDLEDALVARFGLAAAVVADVPAATAGQEADDLARDAVAEVAVDLLGKRRPTGTIAVSWGRTMLEVARRLPMGWTDAQTRSSSSTAPRRRSAQPTRANEILERFAATSGASFRGPRRTRHRGLPDLRDALIEGPGDPRDDRRRPVRPHGRVRPRHPGAGQPASRVRLRERGRAGEPRARGAVGDVIGRFLDADGDIAWPQAGRADRGPAARRPAREAVPHGRGRRRGSRADRARGDPRRRRERPRLRRRHRRMGAGKWLSVGSRTRAVIRQLVERALESVEAATQERLAPRARTPRRRPGRPPSILRRRHERTAEDRRDRR